MLINTSGFIPLPFSVCFIYIELLILIQTNMKTKIIKVSDYIMVLLWKWLSVWSNDSVHNYISWFMI